MRFHRRRARLAWIDSTDEQNWATPIGAGANNFVDYTVVRSTAVTDASERGVVLERIIGEMVPTITVGANAQPSGTFCAAWLYPCVFDDAGNPGTPATLTSPIKGPGLGSSAILAAERKVPWHRVWIWANQIGAGFQAQPNNWTGQPAGYLGFDLRRKIKLNPGQGLVLRVTNSTAISALAQFTVSGYLRTLARLL